MGDGDFAIEGSDSEKEEGIFKDTGDRVLDIDRARRAFFAHMRHELRTPLNAIIGYSEMLLEEAEDLGQGELISGLQKVHEAGRQLLSLVNNILDPLKIEAAVNFDPESFGASIRKELHTPLSQVISYCKRLLEDAEGLGQEAFISDTQKIHAAGNRLSALIDDILNFSSKPEVNTMDLSLKTSDTLTMVQDVMTTIRPLGEGHVRAPEIEQNLILVVDDNETNRDMLSRRLEREGYPVVVAENGRRALEMIQARKFDLVLLDMMMPEMNGYQVLEYMKMDPTLRHIPVIMISAMDEIDSVVRCIEMGAEDYLPKPFNPVLLKARIGASLERKRLHDREVSYRQQLEAFNENLEQRVEAATAQIKNYTQLLERRLREMEAMRDVSIAISSVMDVNLVLTLIMDKSKEVMNAEASSLLMLDKNLGKLRFHVARGTAGAALQSVTVDLGQGIAGWVAKTGEPLLIPDAYKDPRFDPSYDKRSGFRTRSILTVPLKVKEEVTGVVQVINKIGQESFDEHDLNLFLSFASQASVALENAQLYEQTKAMAEDLRKALENERRLAIEKEKMGAYIPKHVVDEISRNREQKLALGGKTVRATILFSDIKGFTRLAETMEPQKVVSFLNVYMTAMANIIEEEGGIIDKFIGDGIMAVFTPLDEEDNHALRAVRSGIRMQQKLRELQKDWAVNRPELMGLQIRVGINTGEVVAGNIGSETRMDYTVIGDNVNLASRIESACRPGEVFISESTYQNVKEFIVGTKMDPLSVKNRVKPVQTYSIQIPPSVDGE